MRRVSKVLPYFLWGLGSQMQIIASLSFTELFVLLAAPFLLTRELPYLRRNGIMPFFWLSILLFAGCVFSCFANHTPMRYALRGMATCCLLPCSILAVHWMLRRNMNGFKWMAVGGIVSLFLCTFIFQKSGDMVAASRSGYEDAAEGIMAGATYWKHRITALVALPSKGWYLQCPLWYSILAPIFMAGLSMTMTVSGRGTAVKLLASAALVVIGGKKRATMSRLCRYFYLLVVVAIFGSFAVKGLYQYAAEHDWLGEKARLKYETQTKGNKGMMALLIGGRMSSFCGLLACADKPIVGFGPWAVDRWGYTEEFLVKYGSPEDLEDHFRSRQFALARGEPENMIPCHSVITEFWLWYGGFGLLFCLYFIFVACRYLRQDCWVVPQWFFWLAAGIPAFFWDTCFNPPTGRIGICTFPVACLLARAVRMGRQHLPIEMIMEIEKSERK